MRTPSAVGGLEPLDRRVEGNNPTVVLEVAGERQHEPMAVDNAGLGREHGGDARERRLELHRRLRRYHRYPFDTIGERLGLDRLEPSELVSVSGDHELSALPVRHTMSGAKLIKHTAAGWTVAGAQGAGGIIEAGMDHLAVARGGTGADGVGGLRHDHVVPGERRRPRTGEPHHPRSDHQHLHGIQPEPDQG